jgi:hypothetical protein
MTAYDQSRVHFLELNPFGEMKEVSPTRYIAGNSTADLWSSDSGNPAYLVVRAYLPLWLIYLVILIQSCSAVEPTLH